MRRFIYNTSNPSYYIQTTEKKVIFNIYLILFLISILGICFKNETENEI